MPTDACQFFYDCKGCGERLKPLAGDCCVFCSYGSVPCPPIQSNLRCCVPTMLYRCGQIVWQNMPSAVCARVAALSRYFTGSATVLRYEVMRTRKSRQG
jgi:hypothetical protein